jgi:uncharacterized membrane protein YccC
MSRIGTWITEGFTPQWVEHAARVTAAVTVSYLAALSLGLPEAYWAPITTMIVVQSTLGAALTISVQRLAGTALGAGLAALAATFAGAGVVVFSAGVFLLGLICAALHLDRTGYRFSCITLAIVLLAGHGEKPWAIAAHRFVEVSLGIAAGLVLTALWPERSGDRLLKENTGNK